MNILLLCGEDTGRHLGCYGDPLRRTPNLDCLAGEGRRYDNAFSHAPVCAPSRGSIVTGIEPCALGIHQMRSTRLNPPDLFTSELVRAGYEVLWPTKLDFNFEPPRHWRTGRRDWWEPNGPGLPTDRPFFAFRNVVCTHESRMWRPTEDDPFVAERVPEADRVDSADVPIPPYFPDLPEVRTAIARYYDNLTAQDAAWGECLAALDRSGRANDTLVLYISDHGRGLPREKRYCYDAGLHLPLIARGPGVAAGTVSDELVSWIDLAPTILAAAGVEVPERMRGRNFLDAAAPPRDFHFAGRDRMDEQYDCQRIARSKRWHYVRNYFPEIPPCRLNLYQEQGEAVVAIREAGAAGTVERPADVWLQPDKPAEELFDCDADPHTVRNVADDPANAAVLREHREALDAHLEQVGDWGAVPETAMVELGLVTDRRADYTKRLDDLRKLPADLMPEPVPTSIEMPRPRPDAQLAERAIGAT